MCRGRKRGLAGIIATQRLAKLAKNVAAEASNFLMGRTFLDIDMQRAADLLGIDRRQAEIFRDLECGRFVGLGPALSRRSITIRIGEVKTHSNASGARLTPLPERTSEEARGLLFQANAPPTPRYVPEPGPGPDELLETIDHAPAVAALALPIDDAPPPPTPPTTTTTPAAPPPPELDRRGGIDAVLAQLFSEEAAIGRTVSALYDDFLARCRSQRLPGRVLDLAHFRRRLVLAQAGVTADVAALPGWDLAVTAANALDEQLQGVFLRLAAAALQELPCPTDAMITQAFGSHSPRRALAALARMEQLGVVEIYEELNGQRVILLPKLQWKTAPGHTSDRLAWSG